MGGTKSKTRHNSQGESGSRVSYSFLRPYLEANQFTAITDNQALKLILKIAKEDGKLDSCRHRLLLFALDVVHRTDVKYQAADALSRLKTGWDTQ